jgi:recombination protein RecR
MLPTTVQQLIQLFARLPSVGEKTAQRFALFLATNEPDTATALGEALVEMANTVGVCERCGNIADAGEDSAPLCLICSDGKREGATLCVVARIQDLMSIERSRAFRGYYFVLGRLLSPLEGVGADDLPLDALRSRMRAEGSGAVSEVLIATPPSVDGEATALMLAQELKPLGVRVTRIATGVPHGGDLEFADPITIGRAIAGRRGLD